MSKSLNILVVGGLLIAVTFAFLLRPADEGLFRGASSFQKHYQSNEAAYDALALYFEENTVHSEVDVCQTVACLRALENLTPAKLRNPAEPDPARLRQLIADLRLPEEVFLTVSGTGQLISRSLSYEKDGFALNTSLHYNGDAQVTLPTCDVTNVDPEGGKCALRLSDTWFLKYAWLPTSLWDPEPGTADAECEGAKMQSFAAYTECMNKSDAPKAKPRCEMDDASAASPEDFLAAQEKFNKCVRDLTARARGF